MNAAAWLKQHANEIPAELGDTEGHLSLNFQSPGEEGDMPELIDSIAADEDHWYLAGDREEVADPDADWLF